MKNNKEIQKAWEKSKKLLAEGNKLFYEVLRLKDDAKKIMAEGRKLYAKNGSIVWGENEKLCVDGYRFKAKARKLCAEWKRVDAEHDTLWLEADLIFMDAVIKEYGNIEIEWKEDGCYLENGEVYKYVNK